MKDELIINGKKYVHTPEVKEKKRLVGYTDGYVSLSGAILLYLEELEVKDIRMIEIREGEIIVSEDDVKYAWRNYMAQPDAPSFDSFLRHLGFKKDGV